MSNKQQVWKGVKTDDLRFYFVMCDDIEQIALGHKLFYMPYGDTPYMPDLLRDGRLFNFGVHLEIMYEG